MKVKPRIKTFVYTQTPPPVIGEPYHNHMAIHLDNGHKDTVIETTGTAWECAQALMFVLDYFNQRFVYGTFRHYTANNSPLAPSINIEMEMIGTFPDMKLDSSSGERGFRAYVADGYTTVEGVNW